MAYRIEVKVYFSGCDHIYIKVFLLTDWDPVVLLRFSVCNGTTDKIFSMVYGSPFRESYTMRIEGVFCSTHRMAPCGRCAGQNFWHLLEVFRGKMFLAWL